MERFLSSMAFGSLHALRKEPTYASAVCETDGIAFLLESDILNDFLETDKDIAKEIIFSLTKEVICQEQSVIPLYFCVFVHA